MKTHHLEVKALPQADGTVSYVASTDAIDRMGDVVRQDGWDLSKFKANPVILWAHDHSTPPIGRAKRIEVKNGRLEMDVEFTPEDVNPFGAMIGRMSKAGFLPAVSVGFRPTQAKPIKSGGYEFTKSELLEVSCVSVPANAEALAFAKSLSFNPDAIRRTFAASQASINRQQEQFLRRHRLNIAKFGG